MKCWIICESENIRKQLEARGVRFGHVEKNHCSYYWFNCVIPETLFEFVDSFCEKGLLLYGPEGGTAKVAKNEQVAELG